MEGFCVAVLPRCAGLNEKRGGALTAEEDLNALREELRTVVGTDGIGCIPFGEETNEESADVFAANGPLEGGQCTLASAGVGSSCSKRKSHADPPLWGRAEARGGGT